MIGSDTLTLFPQGQTLLGKRVSSLVGPDLKVLKDGTVTGTIKKVTGYTQFSSNEEERNGYYFPFKLAKTGTQMTIKKNGIAAEGKENMAFDPDIILRVTKEDTFTIEVDGAQVVTFNFKKAIFV